MIYAPEITKIELKIKGVFQMGIFPLGIHVLRLEMHVAHPETEEENVPSVRWLFLNDLAILALFVKFDLPVKICSGPFAVECRFFQLLFGC